MIGSVAEVVEYLDVSIRYWRGVRDGTTCPPQDETRDIAKYYIDAFQSARVSITGFQLDAEERINW